MVWWRSITRWVSRLFVGGGALSVLSLSGPVSPAYSVDNSMSTLARFPWIWTCVQIIASDLASRPLIAYRRPGRGRKRVEVPDAALDLLAQPNAGQSEYLFRKQLWVDLLLPGNAYVWRPPEGVAIYRLHPRSVRPLPGPLGMVVAYEWTDHSTGSAERRILPPEEVLHIRDVSWTDDPTAVLGESTIRCLHDDLTADLGIRQQAAQAAARGRPDIIFSSKTQLGDGGAEKLVERFEASVSSRRGAFVVGGEVTATPLSWAPTELGQIERSEQIRDTILAVFGVPPSKAGIPGANYATARQEEKAYWTRMMARARVFDDAFSRLAAPGVRIGHDYSTVEALQVSHTERQARVQGWVAMGWAPEDAAAYEGFEGLPPRREAEPAEPAAPDAGDNEDEPAEPAERTLGAVRAAVTLHLRCAEAVYAEAGADVDTRLLVRWQTERLFAALSEAGVEPAHARWWAEELCAVTDEAHRMGLDAFGEERAQRAAEQICARRAA